jgi:hypothetical protein
MSRLEPGTSLPAELSATVVGAALPGMPASADMPWLKVS